MGYYNTMAQAALLAIPALGMGFGNMFSGTSIKRNAPELGASSSYIAPPGDPGSSQTSSNDPKSGKKKKGGGAENTGAAIAQQQQFLALSSSVGVICVFLCVGVVIALALAS